MTPDTTAPPDAVAAFERERDDRIRALGADADLHRRSLDWIMATTPHKYTYNFSWLGRPVIQFPQDLMAVQEIIWRVRPDLVIETGIAHGGSIIFWASILDLLGGDGRVLGVDREIRPHNRAEIEAHPMFRRIDMLEGDSTDPAIVADVRNRAAAASRVLVLLDSNHCHDHVRAELELYGPLVTRDSYLVVFDTIIEDLPAGFLADDRWDKGDNPKTAVHDYLTATDRFAIDRTIPDKLQITVSPDGYLRCLRD